MKLLTRRDDIPARKSKAEFWARLTPARRIALADGLMRQARRLHPEWPTKKMRADDLAAHVRLIERLARASQALRKR